MYAKQKPCQSQENSSFEDIILYVCMYVQQLCSRVDRRIKPNIVAVFFLIYPTSSSSVWFCRVFFTSFIICKLAFLINIPWSSVFIKYSILLPTAFVVVILYLYSYYVCQSNDVRCVNKPCENWMRVIVGSWISTERNVFHYNFYIFFCLMRGTAIASYYFCFSVCSSE